MGGGGDLEGSCEEEKGGKDMSVDLWTTLFAGSLCSADRVVCRVDVICQGVWQRLLTVRCPVCF